MEFTEFQIWRNEQAEKLREIDDIDKRWEQARKLSKKCDRITMKRGYVTQNLYWITKIAEIDYKSLIQ